MFRKKGDFTEARWDALHGRWNAVCRQGSVGLLRTLEPWVHWIPLDLHGFYKWVFDTLGALNGYVRLVGDLTDTGLRNWTRWMQKDLGSRPYHLFHTDYPSFSLRSSLRKGVSDLSHSG